MARRIGSKAVIAVIGLVFVGLPLAGLLYVVSLPAPQIDAETAKRISPGMTEEEVTGIIGGRQGNYGPMDWTLGQRDMDVFYTIPGAKKRLKWTGRLGIILVFIDDPGRVMKADFHPFMP